MQAAGPPTYRYEDDSSESERDTDPDPDFLGLVRIMSKAAVSPVEQGAGHAFKAEAEPATDEQAEPQPTEDVDDTGDLIDDNLACFRGRTAALRAPVDGLRLRVTARVVDMPVLSFVQAEPLLGHLCALPLGVAAPAGKFHSLVVSTVEPDFHQEILPRAVSVDSSEEHRKPCTAGLLCCGTCKDPTMDYFAIPMRTAGYLAGLPRGTRVALRLPTPALDSASVALPFLDLDPWQVPGVLVHVVSSWPSMAFSPELCYPPDDAVPETADVDARRTACCWFGAAFAHAETTLGPRCLRTLTAAEQTTVEDQVALLGKQFQTTVVNS